MLLLSKDDISKIIDMKDMIAAVSRAFGMLEAGLIDTPLRTVIGSPEGSFLTMPSYSGDMAAAAVKVLNVFPGNSARGMATIDARVVYMDVHTGSMLAMMDGNYITQLRTGAATGAAFDLLAKKHCKKGALIGTGGQAACQLDAMLAVRELEEISIFSPDPGHCRAFTERMIKTHPGFKGRMTAASDSSECVADADMIVAVTTSETPVFDGMLVKPGAVVSGVGTYEPGKHELDPELIRRADRIYCDSTDAALSESGDLLIPLSKGIISRQDINGSLGELVNGSIAGRQSDDEIIVFETVGVAAQDLAAAKLIYDRAVVQGAGIQW